MQPPPPPPPCPPRRTGRPRVGRWFRHTPGRAPVLSRVNKKKRIKKTSGTPGRSSAWENGGNRKRENKTERERKKRKTRTQAGERGKEEKGSRLLWNRGDWRERETAIKPRNIVTTGGRQSGERNGREWRERWPGEQPRTKTVGSVQTGLRPARHE